MSLEKKGRPFYRATLGVSPRSVDVEVEKTVGLISIYNEKTQGLRPASTWNTKSQREKSLRNILNKLT